MAEYSFTKIDGGWGIRVWDGPGALSGQVVTVTTKAGAEKQVALGDLVRRDGRLEVYAIVSEQKPSTAVLPLPGPDVVPAGRYAYPVTENGQEVWRFVKIWRKDDRVSAYAVKGLEKGDKVDRREALLAIAAFGPGRAAQEFGWRTGYCARCGDELRVNLSRKLGIGPVCMEKLFDNRTRLNMLREARKELRAAGLEPDAKYDSLEAV
jgi:hypothetical protein